MEKVELDPYKLYNIQDDHTFYIVECDSDDDDENIKMKHDHINDIKYEVIISIRYKNKYIIYHDNINFEYPLYLQNVSDTNYVYNGKDVKCVSLL